MSRCQGEIPVSAKVDRPTYEFVENEAAELGVSKTEFLRRLLDFYRMSQNGEMACEHCGGAAEMELEHI
jgi:negative regulator of replication initiation